MSYEQTVGELGDFRARIILDECPMEPEHECGFPVLRIDWWRGEFDFTGYGDDVLDAADTLRRFVDRFGNREGLDVFERWLRIFHDGRITENGTASRDYTYVAYTCRELADKHGIPAEHNVPGMEEWIAYVEGDVWGYVVERKVDLSGSDYDELVEWVEVDSCWGFYGTEYAEQEAFAALRWEGREFDQPAVPA